VIAFDDQVENIGLKVAALEALQGYSGGIEAYGVENIPRSGPVLILSNHPGMSDTLALFASIPRSDLRILAGDRPFLRALPNVSSRLIYVPDENNGRMKVVRETVSHLRAGGAALTFPAGQIEPDPACMEGAEASLQTWSDSIAVFVRMLPQLVIVPALVSGVVLPAALNHPLTRRRSPGRERERMAASLQILAQTLIPSTRRGRVRVDYGPGLLAADLAQSGGAAEITAGVIRAVALLLRDKAHK
jgi:hypothetical protein